MECTLRSMLVAAICATCFTVQASAADGEDVTAREIAPGEKVRVEPGALEEPASFDLAIGTHHLSLYVNPDGYIRFGDPGMRAVVTVTNSLGNRMSLDLRRGDRISVWPIDRMEIVASGNEFVVSVDAADWAFVVRAETTRPGGLPILCDSMNVKILAGERLDATRDGEKVTFTKIVQSWPGILVKNLNRKSPTAVAVAPREPSGEGDRRPTMPGVLSSRSRQFPWQTVALPVISWEVFRPPDVSP